MKIIIKRTWAERAHGSVGKSVDFRQVARGTCQVRTTSLTGYIVLAPFTITVHLLSCCPIISIGLQDRKLGFWDGENKKKIKHLFSIYKSSNMCYPTWFLQTIHPQLSSHSDDQVSYNRLLHRLIYFPQILFFFYQIDCSASILLFASPQRFVLLTTSHSQY